jgi:hypothetical protein
MPIETFVLDHPEHPSRIARIRLNTELGRLIARMADEPDPRRRCDLADQAYDVLAIVERLNGATSVAHPQGLRLVGGDRS